MQSLQAPLLCPHCFAHSSVFCSQFFSCPSMSFFAGYVLLCQWYSNYIGPKCFKHNIAIKCNETFLIYTKFLRITAVTPILMQPTLKISPPKTCEPRGWTRGAIFWNMKFCSHPWVVHVFCGEGNRLQVQYILCSSRKYPYPPHGRLMEIPRGRGVSKANFF